MEALIGGTLYPDPDSAPIANGVVLIDGDTIAAVGHPAVPEGAHTVDCTGLAIVAGFWNSHVHFFERKWAGAAAIPAPELARQLHDAFTRYGFTSVFDLSSTWENTRAIRDRVRSAEVAGPRIRSTGEGLIAANPGLPPDAVMNFMGVVKTALPEVADAAQARAAARRLLDSGVDGIKLFVSSPSKAAIPEDAIAAAADEAHRAHKPVFVHPNNATDVLTAVRAGADIVGHTTPASGPWDDALLHAMKERNVALTPTLTLWQYYLRHDRVTTQQKTVDTALGQLHAWIAAGGNVLFGTDLGAVDYDPAPEFALMRQAGMSFRQILASLTTIPAARFGDGRRLGRVAPGFVADVVVLKDAETFSDIRYTFADGRVR